MDAAGDADARPPAAALPGWALAKKLAAWALGEKKAADWAPGEQLTELEETMLAHAASGKLRDLGAGLFELGEKAWPAGRTVRASVLRHLLIDDEWIVDAKGVQLRGVRISGQLDFEAATLRCSLRMYDCYLDAIEPVSLDYATAQVIEMIGCRLAGITGNLLAAKAIDLSGSELTGQLLLTAANIAGPLTCDGTKLVGVGGIALFADGIKIGGDAFLDKLTAEGGTVRLAGATIAGQLSCNGARLTGALGGGDTLVADGIVIGGDAFLDKLTAEGGTVRLAGATIAGVLSCNGARLTGAPGGGDAMTADAIKVGETLFLDDLTASAGTAPDEIGTPAGGAVRLLGAEITQGLSCLGTKLTGADSDGDSLVGHAIKVGAGIFLGKGFTASGTVALRFGRVTGTARLEPARPAVGATSLDATGLHVTGGLKWAPTAPIAGRVILEGASADYLEDDWGSGRTNGFWPTDGRLWLDGFTYDRISGSHPATTEQRLAWIRSQYARRATPKVKPPGTDTLSCPGAIPASQVSNFATQPYEQLASVYRAAGQDSQARTVAIARRADLRQFGNLIWYRTVGNWLMDFTIRYGFRTWRAVVGLAFVYVAVLVLSIVAQHLGLITPIGTITGLHPVPSATACTADYPCFYPAGYAIDTVIPIINVHQADFWGINGQKPWGWAWVAGAWLATGLGWTLATLLVAGYTGLARQQ